MAKRLSIMLMLCCALTAGAQSLRLTDYKAPTALYADFNDLYNYNRYEHSRWGIGATWVLPSETAEQPREFLGQWVLHGYGAYGVFDKGWKYGGTARLKLRNARDLTFHLGAMHDLERAADRRLESYRLTATEENTGYLASHFAMVDAVETGAQWKPAVRWKTATALRYSRETALFDTTGVIYPNLDPDATTESHTFGDLKIRLDIDLTANRSKALESHLTLQLTGGMVDMEQPYLRALAQYALGKHDEGFHLWAQAGYVTREAPYSRLFDLSGTGGTPYYFAHTFLTVPPDRLTTDLFAHLCLRYTATLPIWDLSFSKPKPFLQLNTMVLADGKLRVAGERHGNGAPVLVEPATGFDGLIRWGILDIGFATAYLLTPHNAAYQPEDPRECIAITLVAKLIV